MKKLLFSLLLATVLISGCINQEEKIQNIAIQTDLAQEFLQTYPDAEITAAKISSGDVSNIIDEIREKCGFQMTVKNYWKVSINDPYTHNAIISWIDVKTEEVVCNYRISTEIAPRQKTTTTIETKNIALTDAYCDKTNIYYLIRNDGFANVSGLIFYVDGFEKNVTCYPPFPITPDKTTKCTHTSKTGPHQVRIVGPDNAINKNVFCPANDTDIAISLCKRECLDFLNQDGNITNGPCLLNPISGLQDWVCDVAHKPRQEIDNNPTNQCGQFIAGKAHHFVEVDINCNLIKIV